MTDSDKIKEQLLNELIDLRKKIVELEEIKNSPKNTEKQLKKSEQLYNLIFNNSSDIIGITTFSLNPVYIYSPKGDQKMCRYPVWPSAGGDILEDSKK